MTELVSAAPLVRLRVAFGALMALAMARYFAHGWIDAQLVEPRLLFPYPGLEWIRPWPAPWMHLHVAALGGLAVAIAAGLRHRLACVLFCAGFTWMHLLDRTSYLNHYYLVSLLAALLATIDLDRHRARDLVPRWQLALVRLQVGLVYFFAGVAKLTPDWLLAGQPVRIWLALDAGPALVASWAAAAFDLAIPFALAWRRTRRAAFGAVVGFHAVTAALFPIGLFPWIMIAAATVFLDGARGTEPEAPSRREPPRPAVVALAMAFAAVQIALPLRAALYPGDVHWNEAGMRLSWRVMVMEKQGRARFRVLDPVSGAERVVDPRDELTPVQDRMMATQPDMILSYAHHLAALARADGVARPQVRADSYVSLNGRPGRPMIDPTIDLAALPEFTPPWRYVLPLDRND